MSKAHLFAPMKWVKEQFSKLNSDYEALLLRVGYLDYCGENGDGYRINIPANITLNDEAYKVVDISKFFPTGYNIDKDFPTIQATINSRTTATLPAISYCQRYSGGQVLIHFTNNLTGDLSLAIGVRLKKSS